MMQRFFDIVFSAFTLIMILPIVILVVLLLWGTGEGEIFYCQDRIGKSGKKFKLLKFATMLKNSPHLGTGNITVSDDPRVLPVGRFLRKSKINELPQLINVLIGDMSLIGPRPLTPDNFALYSDVVRSQIQKVRPGLSGIGSIVFRDEAKYFSTYRSAEDVYKEDIAPYKGAVEVWYIKNQSLKLYFVLILLTLVVVVRPTSNLHFKLLLDLPDQNKSNINND